MKRLTLFVIFLIITYIMYVDITKGTLPTTIAVGSVQQEPIQDLDETPYIEIEVQAGDTVLSIIERHAQSSVTVPIQQIVEDFKVLNNGLDANKIVIGKTYRFPEYPS